MEKFDNGTPIRRRNTQRVASSRSSTSRTSAEEILARARAERAQLEQGRHFQASLIDEAEQLHEEIGALHEELREIYRQLGNLRRRFTSLPPAPRLAGYPPVAVAPVGQGEPRANGGRATA
ncbi:hypothetical protein [Nocardia salmonicida]|uniref:hypothetical protein n=1 Tax=Nocardia salmonicida TaxID=53431 RepID=UPI002E28E9B5|nr:hypothetical protein [Nocardia salmonicida]